MNVQLEKSDASALDDFVAELLDTIGAQTPPVDAFQLAAAMRIPVARDAHQAGRARLARVRGARGVQARSCILLNEEPRPERRHWAVAHEIGEHLAPELFHRLALDVRETPQLREALANQFANRLLLPTDWFQSHGALYQWDLLELKSIFSTASHELIARRMLDFADPVIITIFDQGKITWRKCTLSTRRPPLSKQEAECRQLVHTTGESTRRSLAEATIRAWAVHEPEWKREIVRTDVHCVF